MERTRVHSVKQLIEEVEAVMTQWGKPSAVWFRGEPRDTAHPLIPSVFREDFDENELLQQFRLRAPILSPEAMPQRGYTDQWLFLAQHVRLPTRLLDWTESLLIAVYFALLSRDNGSVVWMLHPLALNAKATGKPSFGLTWFAPPLDVTAWLRVILQPDRRRSRPNDNYLLRALARLRSLRPRENYANLNIRGAWENDRVGTELPVAIYPPSIHPRMATQKACFTIHRKSHPALCAALDVTALPCFELDNCSVDELWDELRLLGITHSTVFPDLEHLAKELADACRKPTSNLV